MRYRLKNAKHARILYYLCILYPLYYIRYLYNIVSVRGGKTWSKENNRIKIVSTGRGGGVRGKREIKKYI